jgi:trans-2,3-dihydro-3-hydroxyanthranilate isomerase
MKDTRMSVHPVTFVDVFAVHSLEGNFLPVVHDADDLSDDIMARFARRTRQSETSYVQVATSSGADYRHRIFTVAAELPFAGHPSLGTAAAFCHRRGIQHQEVVQQTASGDQRLVVSLDGDSGSVAIWQNEPHFGAVLDASGVLDALEVDPTATDTNLPAQVVSTGLPALLIPLRDPAALSTASFSAPRLAAAIDGMVADPTALNCYLVAEHSPGHWVARSFALDTTGGEDPATGSAAGPLGAYLRERLGLHRLVIDQGVEMGEPSRLYVDTSDGVRVEGPIHISGTGHMYLPSAVGT